MALSAGVPAKSTKEKKTMLYVMICKQHRHEEKRFWFCQERQFVMPVSEKQIMPVTRGTPMDT